MSTTDPAAKMSKTVEDDGMCDVCSERRARWVAAEQQDFRICGACREGEPCGRCAYERDRCECAEGPDIFTWLPIAGRG